MLPHESRGRPLYFGLAASEALSRAQPSFQSLIRTRNGIKGDMLCRPKRRWIPSKSALRTQNSPVSVARFVRRSY